MKMLLLAFVLLGVPTITAAASRPNVVFILADDMGQWAARSVLFRLCGGHGTSIRLHVEMCSMCHKSIYYQKE